MCGEKNPMPMNATSRTGSPPRVRGKASLSMVPTPILRITPACAGKRAFLPVSVLVVRDHPRVCGEKSVCVHPVPVCAGSPPRVRGKDAVPHDAADGLGITPACAGKSAYLQKRGFKRWDHPRVCGEKLELVHKPIQVIGSPPRVRGKAISQAHLPPLRRITPACAGKRLCSVFVCWLCWDHPRVCGEKHACVSIWYGRLRITPACAGKRFPAGGCNETHGDHPRVCGEKDFAYSAELLILGSPPRVRGKD